MIEALGEIGDADTIDALEELRGSIDSEALHDTIEEAIELCAERVADQ